MKKVLNIILQVLLDVIAVVVVLAVSCWALEVYLFDNVGGMTLVETLIYTAISVGGIGFLTRKYFIGRFKYWKNYKNLQE